MTISEFNAKIHTLFPPETAWSGDKIGLQIDRASDEDTIRKVLVAYEITKEVLQEAITLQACCICVFHPLIFKPLEQISSKDRIGALVQSLIRHNIGLIVIHTNFDTHPAGTNALAAEALGLEKNTLKTLVPDPLLKDFGMGIVGSFSQPMPIARFIDHCSVIFNAPIRYCLGKSEEIQTVALICGSGFSYFNQALASGADCFITADIKYHGFHEAKDSIMLIDPGHSEMEQFVTKGMTTLLMREDDFSEITFISSQVLTSPVHYYQSK